MRIHIRDARPDDHATIVEFNARLAFETEHKTLDPRVIDRGVALALGDPDRLRYWIAEDASTGQVIGQAAITREWSDWRAGWIWWFQSVYVHAEARSQGVFRSLHAHIRSLARESPGVVGLRLYVENANHRAQATYKSLGMLDGNYHVYEDLWVNGDPSS